MLPKSNEIISYKLELRQKGKKTTTFVSGGTLIDTSKPLDITVAVYPVDDSSSTSNKLKYYIGERTGSFSGVGDNPLKGFGFSSKGASPTPLQGESRAFILKEYQTAGKTTFRYPDPNNLMLVFTIEPK